MWKEFGALTVFCYRDPENKAAMSLIILVLLIVLIMLAVASAAVILCKLIQSKQFAEFDQNIMEKLYYDAMTNLY